MNTNPIIIIDDDEDDLELIKHAFAELKIENEIITFNAGKNFLEFVKTPIKAFLIICDINMTPIDGLELKKLVHENEMLRLRSVPFIFMSTSSAPLSIMKAYSYGVQGYFVKPNNFQGTRDTVYRIVEYWRHSLHPNC